MLLLSAVAHPSHTSLLLQLLCQCRRLASSVFEQVALCTTKTLYIVRNLATLDSNLKPTAWHADWELLATGSYGCSTAMPWFTSNAS
jgi:hypothetical protein